MKSTHKVEVVEIQLKEHPNADSLSVCMVDGYTVCVQTIAWQNGMLGAYIPPDSIVDTSKEEFKFLSNQGDKVRIKVKKLRGVISMGLLVPAPPDSKIGDDVASILEVEHYEPEIKFKNSDAIKGPSGCYPKYDIDSIRKYNKIFLDREPVFISEKIHGENARYTYTDMMYCGSRNQWKKESDTDREWKAYKNHPGIHALCKDNPNLVLYGEAYGQVQKFTYGKTDVYFMAFDILQNGMWLNVNNFLEMCKRYDVPTVPVIHLDYPFNFTEIEQMSNGSSLISGADHPKEGVVIKPMKERYDSHVGRVILKLVGNDYYMNKKS